MVHGWEVFYGGGGVEQCRPGTTQLGPPLKKISLGNTAIDFAAFTDYVNGVRPLIF